MEYNQYNHHKHEVLNNLFLLIIRKRTNLLTKNSFDGFDCKSSFTYITIKRKFLYEKKMEILLIFTKKTILFTITVNISNNTPFNTKKRKKSLSITYIHNS